MMTRGEKANISLLVTMKLETESRESYMGILPEYIFGKFTLSLAIVVLGFSTIDPKKRAVLLLSQR